MILERSASPSYIAGGSDYLPAAHHFHFSSSNSGFQNLSVPRGANNIPSQSFQLFEAIGYTSRVTTSFKFGGDVRQYRLNTFTAGNSTGSYNFSARVTATCARSSTRLLLPSRPVRILLLLPPGPPLRRHLTTSTRLPPGTPTTAASLLRTIGASHPQPNLEPRRALRS